MRSFLFVVVLLSSLLLYGYYSEAHGDDIIIIEGTPTTCYMTYNRYTYVCFKVREVAYDATSTLEPGDTFRVDREHYEEFLEF